MTSFLVFLAIVAAIVIWAIGIYNRLINERNRVRNGFAQIDVQLTRRYDLIPNLVETAKAYMSHERETLEAVIAARNQAMAGLQAAAKDPGNADTMSQLANAEGALGGALGRVVVVEVHAHQVIVERDACCVQRVHVAVVAVAGGGDLAQVTEERDPPMTDPDEVLHGLTGARAVSTTVPAAGVTSPEAGRRPPRTASAARAASCAPQSAISVSMPSFTVSSTVSIMPGSTPTVR